MSKACFRPKLMFFQQKSLDFLMFQQFRQTKFSLPDLTGLMEHFYRISTGRTFFWKTLTFESNQVENRAISGTKASSLYFFKKQSEYSVGIFLSSY